LQLAQEVVLALAPRQVQRLRQPDAAGMASSISASSEAPTASTIAAVSSRQPGVAGLKRFESKTIGSG
jgi:hypothetical protein